MSLLLAPRVPVHGCYQKQWHRPHQARTDRHLQVRMKMDCSQGRRTKMISFPKAEVVVAVEVVGRFAYPAGLWMDAKDPESTADLILAYYLISYRHIPILEARNTAEDDFPRSVLVC